MKTTTKTLAASLAALTGIGAAALGFSAVSPAIAQGFPPTVPAPQPPVFRQHPGQGGHKGERHPEIRRALANLNRAKGNLQSAAHDFYGHREQALDLVNRAIDQCQQALADDKK